MSDWPQKPLSDVATIDRNSVQPDDIASGSTYLGLEHIESGGKILKRPVVENGELKSSKFRFTSSHILYGKLRPYLGKITCPDFDGVCSTDILPVLPNKDMDRRYVCYYLQQPHIVDLANSKSSGANLPRLSPTALSQIPLPVPPLSEQKRIAEILDRAEALRAKRRAALALLDELTQSIFLDMFGDPIHNEKGWQCATLAEIAQFENGDRSSNYPSGDDIKTEGVLFLSTKNIVDRQLELRDAVFITHEKFKSLSRGKLKPMDLIITLRGTLGSCCLFDSDYDTGFINAQMMIIRPRESALPRFLHAMLTTKQAKDQFKRIGHGGAVPQLTATQLSKLVFALPPVDLQKAFCERLHSSEELIAKHETSLGELDQLFASLQHRAFRGELSSAENEGTR